MLEVGQLLGDRYQLQQKLGRNAGRQTWLATDTETQTSELVIVKLLAFSPQLQWDDFKLFEREAQVLRNLSHPRIPRYRDYFSIDQHTGTGLCWFGLVQDYIPGASLQQLLDQGKRFTEAQVISLAMGVLEILIYLHQLSPPVLHRDIKPSNLIFGEDEQIYLVDFGAVQDSATAEGVTFTVVGTSGYAPIEQFWGRAVPASDLYALGATLIHLLTGTSPAELPQRNLRIQFSDGISINPSFVRWIEALTEPDLEQRYTNAQLALEDLKTGRSLSCPLQAVPQPVGSRLQLWKSLTQLRIEIPGRGLACLIEILTFSVKLTLVVGSVISLLLLGLLLVGMVALTIAAIPAGWPLFFLVPLTFFLSQLWMMVFKELDKVAADLNQPLLTSFCHYSIHLDPDNFVIEKQLFGFSYLRRIGRTSSIKSVEQNAFKGLMLKTRRLKYLFGQDLTERECRWLAQQVQDWLHLNQRKSH